MINISRSTWAMCGTALVVSTAFSAGCSSASDNHGEGTGVTSEALSGPDAGTITISGTVADAQFPQAGITITLSGSAQGKVVTSFSGAYKFTVKPGGSYSLTAAGTPNFFLPPFQSCLKVEPSIVNLNNLTASTTVNFLGSGTDVVTNCSPAATSGATSGSFALTGTVTSGGQPVPGVRVSITGSAQGYRVTDEKGAYSFAVNPGSFSLKANGACASFSPSTSNINNLKGNTTQNFQGNGCPPAPLALCPTFDALFGLSEPAACNDVSTTSCAGDRLATWAGNVAINFQGLTGGSDCRFGQWLNPPIVNDFTSVGISQQSSALNLFTLQLFGCALDGNLVGPLPYAGVLIPPDLVRAKLALTSADVAALTDDFIAAINLTLSQNGSPPLTSAQTAAILTPIRYAASHVPGVTASNSLSYSTCAADAGAE